MTCEGIYFWRGAAEGWGNYSCVVPVGGAGKTGNLISSGRFELNLEDFLFRVNSEKICFFGSMDW